MEKLGNQKLTGNPVHDCIRTALSRRMMQRNCHWCPFKQKCYRESAIIFSRVLFSGVDAPDYQIKMSYILPNFKSNSPIFSYISGQISYISLYFRSKSPIFSYISGLNLLYFCPSPIFFGSLVA